MIVSTHTTGSYFIICLWLILTGTVGEVISGVVEEIVVCLLTAGGAAVELGTVDDDILSAAVEVLTMSVSDDAAAHSTVTAGFYKRHSCMSGYMRCTIS